MRPANVKSGLSQAAGPSDVPVAGKTYSLFGSDLSTEPYYDRVRRLADDLVRIVPGEESLLALIRKVGGRKRHLARVARREDGSALSSILRLLGNALSPYATNVRTRLNGLTIRSVTDRGLEGRRAFGVLGIACIPELAWGMRDCMKRKIPVVGIPLDANRCMRWMGRFEDTSVNLEP
jgi:hypothetical protein